MNTQLILNTERLTLRPHNLNDAPSIAKYLQSGEVASTMVLIPFPYDVKTAEEWFNSLPERRRRGDRDFAITLQTNGEFIGNIALNQVDKASARAELGYWIGKPHWGRGYGTEAAAAAVKY